jgi:hypothetical protein
MPSSGMLHSVALVRTDIPPKHRFLQEPHGITSQKMAFFISSDVKTSNHTQFKSNSEILYVITLVTVLIIQTREVITLEVQLT